MCSFRVDIFEHIWLLEAYKNCFLLMTGTSSIHLIKCRTVCQKLDLFFSFYIILIHTCYFSSLLWEHHVALSGDEVVNVLSVKANLHN